MDRCRPLIIFCSSLCSLWLSGSIFAASPRDEVLRLVPDDAGFCLLVQDLRTHFDQVRQSPFAQRFQSSKIGRSILASQEMQSLATFEKQLSSALQMTLAQLRDEILGDAIAVAYTPGPPDKPDQERGLLLIHAQKPERLAALLSRLNELQKSSGELLAVESRTVDGQTIVSRKKRNGEEFYSLRGSILVFSNQEDRVQLALELDRRRPTTERETPAVAKRMQALGVDRNGLVLWINPRAFDARIKQKLEAAQGPEVAVSRTFAACWNALDGVALTAGLESDLSLSFVVQGRPDALPAPIRRLFAEARRPAAVWSSFAADALFAAAGRIPWDAAADTGREILAPEAHQVVREGLEHSVGAVLGRETLPELLRSLGPEWGVCVSPPDGGSKVWLPSLTAVLRLRAGGGDIPVEKRVLDGLDFAARLAVLGINSQHSTRWQFRSQKQGEVEVRFVDSESGLPPGLQPAYAWKGGYLVLASSPEAVRRFTPPIAADPPAGEGETPLVRLAVTGWSRYLRAYREPLTKFAADAHKIEAAEVNRRLDHVLDVLDLLDSLELTQRSNAGVATMTLRVRAAAGLK